MLAGEFQHRLDAAARARCGLGRLRPDLVERLIDVPGGDRADREGAEGFGQQLGQGPAPLCAMLGVLPQPAPLLLAAEELMGDLIEARAVWDRLRGGAAGG